MPAVQFLPVHTTDGFAALVLAFNASDPTWAEPAAPAPVVRISIPAPPPSVRPEPAPTPPPVAALPDPYVVQDKTGRCLAAFACPAEAKRALDKSARGHKMVRACDGVVLAHRVAIPPKVLAWMGRVIGE